MGWRHIRQIASVSGLCLLLTMSLIVVFALQRGTKLLSIQSGSMAPTLHKGDLVVVNRIPDKNYQVGDVITFINPHNDKQTITHRVQQVLPSDGMQEKRVVTKGDANTAADIPVYASKIVGKVSFGIPYLGLAFDFVRQPIGLLLAIYIPALTIVMGEMRRLARYYKEQEPYIASGFKPEQPRHSQAKRITKAGSIVTIATVTAAVPSVQAALISTTTLSGNSISSAPILNHLVISRVVFGDSGNSSTSVTVSNNNSQTATSGNATVSNNGGGNATSGNASNNNSSTINFNVSRGGGISPAVMLYNPTNSPVSLSGWSLSDNTSMRALPTGTTIAAHADYAFSWPQAGGLDRLGDRLLLRDATKVLTDAISWGTDTSQFNPAVVIHPGTRALNRISINTDSDSSADWTAV